MKVPLSPEGHLNGFNTELFWCTLWQWEKWTIKYLFTLSISGLSDDRGGTDPGMHSSGAQPCLQPGACALLRQETHAAGSSIAATADLKEVCDQRAEAKAVTRGVVSAQRMLWNSNTCGEKQFLPKDCVSRFRFYAARFESIEVQLPFLAALLNKRSGIASRTEFAAPWL